MQLRGTMHTCLVEGMLHGTSSRLQQQMLHGHGLDRFLRAVCSCHVQQ